MGDSETTIFVYGTLKKGNYFHSSFLGSADFLGDYTTSSDYSLYVGKWPYLIEEEDVPIPEAKNHVEGEFPKELEKRGVEGEVYKVDKNLLERLDYLEGHPDFYERKKITVYGKDGSELEAWAYIYPKKESETLTKVYNYV